MSVLKIRRTVNVAVFIGLIGITSSPAFAKIQVPLFIPEIVFDVFPRL